MLDPHEDQGYSCGGGDKEDCEPRGVGDLMKQQSWLLCYPYSSTNGLQYASDERRNGCDMNSLPYYL